MRTGIIHATLIACTVTCVPATAVPPRDADRTGPLARLHRISSQFSQLGDWEPHHQRIDKAIDRFWEDNAWNSDSHQYARYLTKQVAAIPPWDVNGRLDVVNRELVNRYRLNEDQSQRLRQRINQVIGNMFTEHGTTIGRHAQEAMQHLRNNEPFNAEEIARWTSESDDIFADFTGQFEAIVSDFAPELDMKQRALYERDFESFQQRMESVRELRERWKRGGWQPTDWGLDGDPIQDPEGFAREQERLAQIEIAEAAMAQRRREAAAGNRPDPADAIPYRASDESTWVRYVRWFIQRYELSESQANTALSILRELQQRAARYRRQHEAELAQVPPNQAPTAEIYEPIRKLFKELVTRLNRVPSTAQIRRVMRERRELTARIQAPAPAEASPE